MTTTRTDEDESITLAAWPRRNRETGASEQLRVTTGDFQGRQVTSIRIWFEGRSGGQWRPTKVGVALREHELDEAIEALEAARRLIHAEGRTTAPTPKRGPPTRVQRPPERPGLRSLHNPSERPSSVPSRPKQTSRTVPPWEGDFDEFN